MNLARLVCRPALPQDTPAILELTRHIWDGHDYIPFVWQDWLRDEEGLLVVAQLGSQIVGMGKLTKITAGEWWLEGLRVHPDFEGQGIATHIQTFLLDFWQKIGSGAIRLVTASQRIAVHRICQKSGFIKVAELKSFSASAIQPSEEMELGAAGEHFVLITDLEWDEAWKFIEEHRSRSSWTSFVDLGWQWYPLHRQMLLQFIQNKNAYWWRGRQGLLLVGEDKDEESGDAFTLIRWLGCDFANLATCLLDSRVMAAKRGNPKVSWIARFDKEVEQALITAGYENDWDFSLYLFEKWYNPAEP